MNRLSSGVQSPSENMHICKAGSIAPLISPFVWKSSAFPNMQNIVNPLYLAALDEVLSQVNYDRLVFANFMNHLREFIACANARKAGSIADPVGSNYGLFRWAVDTEKLALTKYLVSLGGDVHYDNDILFDLAKGKPEILNYLKSV